MGNNNTFAELAKVVSAAKRATHFPVHNCSQNLTREFGRDLQ